MKLLRSLVLFLFSFLVITVNVNAQNVELVFNKIQPKNVPVLDNRRNIVCDAWHRDSVINRMLIERLGSNADVSQKIEVRQEIWRNLISQHIKNGYTEIITTTTETEIQSLEKPDGGVWLKSTGEIKSRLVAYTTLLRKPGTQQCVIALSPYEGTQRLGGGNTVVIGENLIDSSNQDNTVVIKQNSKTAFIPIYIELVGIKNEQAVRLFVKQFIGENWKNFRLVGREEQAQRIVRIIAQESNQNFSQEFDQKQAVKNTVIYGSDEAARRITNHTRNRVDDLLYDIYDYSAKRVYTEKKVKSTQINVRSFSFGITIRSTDRETGDVITEAYSEADFQIRSKEGQLIDISGDLPNSGDQTKIDLMVELGALNKTLFEMKQGVNFIVNNTDLQ